MEISSIGLGTYLGDPGPATDGGYRDSARAFAAAGGTVFDTAANYRMGRSERALGQVLGGLDRDAFFVRTKAGYLPMADGVTQENPRAWFQRVLAGPGVLSADEVVDGCHAMTPRYLAHQLEVSLEALRVSRVDLFHLHNPEQQRPALGPAGFRAAMRRAFEACERMALEGRIGAYGCATWNGFRVPSEAADHLCLEELLEDARAVGGPDHHFRWIQLPLNLAMPEAFTLATQAFGGERLTPLAAARAAGLQVQISASLMQARILGKVPADLLPGCRTPAQAALQFARSCPGVATALCGMANPGHVAENLELLGRPRAEPQELLELLG